MSENGKFPDYTGIWDSASQARDIHLALMFALATTAFIEGWEALRPHMPSGKQHLASGDETKDAANSKPADAV
jgi:hypothetical protein